MPLTLQVSHTVLLASGLWGPVVDTVTVHNNNAPACDMQCSLSEECFPHHFIHSLQNAKVLFAKGIMLYFWLGNF